MFYIKKMHLYAVAFLCFTSLRGSEERTSKYKNLEPLGDNSSVKKICLHEKQNSTTDYHCEHLNRLLYCVYHFNPNTKPETIEQYAIKDYCAHSSHSLSFVGKQDTRQLNHHVTDLMRSQGYTEKSIYHEITMITSIARKNNHIIKDDNR